MQRSEAATSAENVDPKAVRRWAQEQGYEVSARGRVSKARSREYLAQV
ncbi:Lsr2 family DNA-binding protein [Motilibacter deserti]